MSKITDKMVVDAARELIGTTDSLEDVIIDMNLDLFDNGEGIVRLSRHQWDLADDIVLPCSECGFSYDAEEVFQQSGELVCEKCYDRELGED